jgi:O-antigen ligase
MSELNPKLFEKILFFFFGITPLFLVTVRSWTNVLLILGAIFSLFFLIKLWMRGSKNETSQGSFEKLMLIALMAPIFSVAIGSILRGKSVASDYDSASRFFIAIAILLFALRKHYNFANFLQYSAPASLILTYLHQIFFPQPHLWGADRMATYFADPLVFGYTSLTLGLISLTSIHLLKIDTRLGVAFKLLGAMLGLYLSIRSGSRTGWLAFPIILALLLYLKLKAKGGNFRLLIVSIIIAMTIIIGLFLTSKTISDRVHIAVQEVSSYSWIGMAPETSVGMRITFLRMATDLFVAHPFMGYGDIKLSGAILPAHIYTYASPPSVDMALNSGFHNEMVTNAIRNGVLALLAAFMLFAMPFYIFLKKHRSRCHIQRGNASLGLVFTLCTFISSLSTEVFDLKYTVSFYALMISLLVASSLTTHPSPQPNDQQSDEGKK